SLFRSAVRPKYRGANQPRLAGGRLSRNDRFLIEIEDHCLRPIDGDLRRGRGIRRFFGGLCFLTHTETHCRAAEPELDLVAFGDGRCGRYALEIGRATCRESK